MSHLSYHYGVFLGDGFIQNYKEGSSVVYIGLKCIDKDFVEHYRETLRHLTGKFYSLLHEKPKGPNNNPRYYCKVAHRPLVEQTLLETRRKECIPESVLQGSVQDKKDFIQGVMDSEAWITCSLNPIGPSYIQLSVGVVSDWIVQLHGLFADIGVTVTKINTRKHTQDPKYLKPRKDFHSFSIHVLEYADAGMSFNIQRKRDRLQFCSRILRDFTREYPKYKDYFGEKIKSGE